MSFAPFPPAPRHVARPACELPPERPRAPLIHLPESARGPLVPQPDLAITRAWAASAEAGRIGPSAPPPAPSASGDLRLASLARILGLPA